MATAPRKTPAAAKKTARAAVPAKVAPAPVAAEVKVKKPKLVRDSFTIPKNEYSNIESLKQKSALLGSPAKKSELLRAGIQLLTTLSDAQLRKALAQIPTAKTGRPNKQK
jgi:hypothetical protein